MLGEGTMPTKKRATPRRSVKRATKRTTTTAKRKVKKPVVSAEVKRLRQQVVKAHAEVRAAKAKILANNKIWQTKLKKLQTEHAKKIELAKSQAYETALNDIIKLGEQSVNSRVKAIELAISKFEKQALSKIEKKIKAKIKKKPVKASKKKTTAKKRKTVAKTKVTAKKRKPVKSVKSVKRKVVMKKKRPVAKKKTMRKSASIRKLHPHGSVKQRTSIRRKAA